MSDSQYYHQGISKNNLATSSPNNNNNNSSSSSMNIDNQTIRKKGISPQNSQQNNNDNDAHIAYTTPFSLNRTKTADGINSNQIKNATTNTLKENANDRMNAITSLPIFSDTQQQTEEKKFSNSDAIKPEFSFIQQHPNYPSHSQILTNEKNHYIRNNKNEPSITINIGRIDIRAIQQQQQQQKSLKGTAGYS